VSAHDIASEDAPPAFAEPWQAQAFATAVQLSRRGVFAWRDWVAVFSAEIARHPQGPDEDSDAAYYRQWLAALETILTGSGLVSAAEIGAAMEHWRRSYLNTPHGAPIEFRRDWPDVPDAADTEARDHDHDHHHDDHPSHRAPLAVSPGTPA
jgi:nitrile hydratase accessory protein